MRVIGLKPTRTDSEIGQKCETSTLCIGHVDKIRLFSVCVKGFALISSEKRCTTYADSLANFYNRVWFLHILFNCKSKLPPTQRHEAYHFTKTCHGWQLVLQKFYESHNRITTYVHVRFDASSSNILSKMPKKEKKNHEIIDCGKNLENKLGTERVYTFHNRFVARSSEATLLNGAIFQCLGMKAVVQVILTRRNTTKTLVFHNGRVGSVFVGAHFCCFEIFHSPL